MSGAPPLVVRVSRRKGEAIEEEKEIEVATVADRFDAAVAWAMKVEQIPEEPKKRQLLACGRKQELIK